VSKKITLPSGAVLDITLMPFKTAWAVSQTVIKELGRLEVDTSILSLFKNERDYNVSLADILSLKSPVCAILSNKIIEEEAITCFTKCTYKGLRITEDTFEAEESRGDYIYACFHVLSSNLSPFFTSLTSFLPKK
jgi:hypothetical protein